MIELLGVGVPRGQGRWWLHRVCTRLADGRVTAVLSRHPGERRSLVDAITARQIPEEGRVWVAGVPVMRETAARVRLRVGDVDPGAALNPRRSVLWNALASGPAAFAALQGALRMPRPAQRAEALALLERLGITSPGARGAADLDAEEAAAVLAARELLRRPRYLVLRDPDRTLGLAGAMALIGRAMAVAQPHPMALIATLESVSLARRCADRLVGLAEGALVLDAPVTAIEEGDVQRRLEGPGAPGRWDAAGPEHPDP